MCHTCVLKYPRAIIPDLTDKEDHSNDRLYTVPKHMYRKEENDTASLSFSYHTKSLSMGHHNIRKKLLILVSNKVMELLQ